MILDEHHLQTLIQLGLSPNQGKIYLNLLNIGKSTGRELANETHLARQEIYRVIHELENTGLVEKIISNPTEFQAVPIQVCISILMTKKTHEMEQIKQRIQSLIVDFSSINTEDTRDKREYRFLLIPPKKLANETRERMISRSKKKIDLITSSRRFGQGVSNFFEAYRGSLKRNVISRVIVIGKEETELSYTRKVKKFEKFSNFSIKFISEQKTSILIVDDKEAIITLVPDSDLGSSPVFWSDHPELIAVYSSYFDTVWSEKKNAKEHFIEKPS